MNKKIGSHQTLADDILMRSIKIFDIGYITILYIFISLISATFIDKVMGEFDEKKEKQKSALKLTLEFILTNWLYGIFSLILILIWILIPIFSGSYGKIEWEGYQQEKNIYIKQGLTEQDALNKVADNFNAEKLRNTIRMSGGNNRYSSYN